MEASMWAVLFYGQWLKGATFREKQDAMQSVDSLGFMQPSTSKRYASFISFLPWLQASRRPAADRGTLGQSFHPKSFCLVDFCIQKPGGDLRVEVQRPIEEFPKRMGSPYLIYPYIPCFDHCRHGDPTCSSPKNHEINGKTRDWSNRTRDGLQRLSTLG